MNIQTSSETQATKVGDDMSSTEKLSNQKDVKMTAKEVCSQIKLRLHSSFLRGEVLIGNVKAKAYTVHPQRYADFVMQFMHDYNQRIAELLEANMAIDFVQDVIGFIAENLELYILDGRLRHIIDAKPKAYNDDPHLNTQQFVLHILEIVYNEFSQFLLEVREDIFRPCGISCPEENHFADYFQTDRLQYGDVRSHQFLEIVIMFLNRLFRLIDNRSITEKVKREMTALRGVTVVDNFHQRILSGLISFFLTFVNRDGFDEGDTIFQHINSFLHTNSKFIDSIFQISKRTGAETLSKNKVEQFAGRVSRSVSKSILGNYVTPIIRELQPFLEGSVLSKSLGNSSSITMDYFDWSDDTFGTFEEGFFFILNAESYSQFEEEISRVREAVLLLEEQSRSAEDWKELYHNSVEALELKEEDTSKDDELKRLQLILEDIQLKVEVQELDLNDLNSQLRKEKEERQLAESVTEELQKKIYSADEQLIQARINQAQFDAQEKVKEVTLRLEAAQYQVLEQEEIISRHQSQDENLKTQNAAWIELHADTEAQHEIVLNEHETVLGERQVELELVQEELQMREADVSIAKIAQGKAEKQLETNRQENREAIGNVRQAKAQVENNLAAAKKELGQLQKNKQEWTEEAQQEIAKLKRTNTDSIHSIRLAKKDVENELNTAQRNLAAFESQNSEFKKASEKHSNEIDELRSFYEEQIHTINERTSNLHVSLGVDSKETERKIRTKIRRQYEQMLESQKRECQRDFERDLKDVRNDMNRDYANDQEQWKRETAELLDTVEVSYLKELKALKKELDEHAFRQAQEARNRRVRENKELQEQIDELNAEVHELNDLLGDQTEDTYTAERESPSNGVSHQESFTFPELVSQQEEFFSTMLGNLSDLLKERQTLVRENVASLQKQRLSTKSAINIFDALVYSIINNDLKTLQTKLEKTHDQPLRARIKAAKQILKSTLSEYLEQEKELFRPLAELQKEVRDLGTYIHSLEVVSSLQEEGDTQTQRVEVDISTLVLPTERLELLNLLEGLTSTEFEFLKDLN